MEYKKHGVAGVEGGPEGQRTQVFLFNPIHTELKTYLYERKSKK